MSDFFNNQRILDIIWKRKYHFIIIGIIAVVLSSIFSSAIFITPRFKSTIKVFPANLGALSDETYTEQMLEIMNSVDLKLKIIDTFRLDTVYKIPRESHQYQTNILDRYSDRVNIRQTDYEAVTVSVEDIDPVRASRMCDSMIHFYDLKVHGMYSVKNQEMLTILSNNLEKRQRECDSIIPILREQRSQNQFLDIETQAPEVTRGYMLALAEGRENAAGTREIKKIYDNMLEKGAQAQLLGSRFNYLITSIDSLNKEIDFHKSEINKKITYSILVDKPIVADKKSYPVRWLIVALTLASTLFVALLAFMIIDFKK
ncbi:MAG: hypothetical protein FWG22_01015 [Prolixibacteraceae bacterium]|nr:hypothetical protein [Prolixibacteraceae bacterium]